ncbi:MAG: hypothetical protein AABX88_00270 [Nanoarchaeota archaeon]
MTLKNKIDNFLQSCEYIESFKKGEIICRGSEPEKEQHLVNEGYIRNCTTNFIVMNLPEKVSFRHYVYTEKGKRLSKVSSLFNYIREKF